VWQDHEDEWIAARVRYHWFRQCGLFAGSGVAHPNLRWRGGLSVAVPTIVTCSAAPAGGRLELGLPGATSVKRR
jgi:hypothetical protein